jgi:hypothetical protein
MTYRKSTPKKPPIKMAPSCKPWQDFGLGNVLDVEFDDTALSPELLVREFVEAQQRAGR